MLKNNAQNEFKNVPEKKLKPETEPKKNKKNKLIDLMNYLNTNYDFRYNLFAAKPEVKSKKDSEFNFLDEREFDNLKIETKIQASIDITDNDFRSLIGSKVISEDYDPIKKYIFALPKWDGVERFVPFLQKVQLKDETERAYLIKYFQKWFVAMVASLVYDSVINDTCFVFSGKQGRGKTRFYEALVPKELRLLYTFTGNFNPRDKDHLEMLGTKIQINIDEMATLTRTDSETLKTTMSMKYVVLRRAFGRAPIHLFRKASFCGSINEDEFLTDQTGNRRWLPFAIHDIDLTEDFDIGLLYAQALAMYKDGFNIYFDRNEIAELEQHNEKYRRVTMEEEMLLTNYRVPTKLELETNSFKCLTTTDITNKMASSDTYKKINVNDTMLKRMGRSLIKLGFQSINRRLPGRNYPVRVWLVRELEYGEADKFKSGHYLEELPI